MLTMPLRTSMKRNIYQQSLIFIQLIQKLSSPYPVIQAIQLIQSGMFDRVKALRLILVVGWNCDQVLKFQLEQMIENQENEIDNEQIKFQFLLRNLPLKERAAWLQVCGNQSKLNSLEQWIYARRIIKEILGKSN